MYWLANCSAWTNGTSGNVYGWPNVLGWPIALAGQIALADQMQRRFESVLYGQNALARQMETASQGKLLEEVLIEMGARPIPPLIPAL